MAATMTLAAAGVSLAKADDKPAPNWVKQINKTDHFEVEFSGPVEISKMELSPEVMKVMSKGTQYLEDGGAFAYIVAVTEYTKPISLENGSKASFESLKCESSQSRDLTAGGISGREIDGANCAAGKGLARYFVVGNTFYQTITVVPDDATNKALAVHFLDSFKITN